MNNQMLLSELIAKTKEALLTNGLKKRTMQMYNCYGFALIQRYYEEEKKSYYSEKLTWEFVLSSRTEYNNGNININKFRYIRRVADMLSEYYKTGSVQWKCSSPWRTTSLGDLFSKYLKMFESKKLTEGFSIRTMRGYKPIAKHFLRYIEKTGHKNLKHITREDIVHYLHVLAEDYTNIGDTLPALRSFGAFLIENDIINIDMVSVLRVSIPVRRKYSFGFTQEEVNKILSAIDRSTVCGKRDYAILMMAKYTGLRAIDVLSLKLNEINWHNREVNIIQHKTEKSLTLPLNINVCNALADYILNARPQSEQPYIFLRAKSPFSPLKTWSGYSIVKRNAAKIGITWDGKERKGFHSFRRSLGNWMLEAEIPIETISEVLGHTSTDSSKPHLSTHQSQLNRDSEE